MEIWKDIPGYEGLYQVSNTGRVRGLTRVNARGRRIDGKIMKPQKNKQTGYLHIVLWKNCKMQQFATHTLVLLAFISPRSDGLECNHLNGIRDDNRLENLEYCTRSENRLHSYRVLGNGYNKAFGESHCLSILTNDKVKEIRALYATGEYYQRTLAKMFGVSQRTIFNIIHKTAWKQVNP